MKAIILAAGLGSRLRPMTEKVPKCMVTVNGECIIDRAIQNLIENDIFDVTVVSGYKGKILRDHLSGRFPEVRVMDNEEYATTNNMFSLWQCRTFVSGEEFILMNGDVFFDAEIIAGLLRGKHENMIACERGRFLEESMKISVRGDGTIGHICKTMSPEEAYGVSIDIYKLGVSGGIALFSEVSDIIERKGDRNSWTEVALDRCFAGTPFYPYTIEGRWMEIDDHDDLRHAEELFKS